MCLLILVIDCYWWLRLVLGFSFIYNAEHKLYGHGPLLSLFIFIFISHLCGAFQSSRIFWILGFFWNLCKGWGGWKKAAFDTLKNKIGSTPWEVGFLSVPTKLKLGLAIARPFSWLCDHLVSFDTRRYAQWLQSTRWSHHHEGYHGIPRSQFWDWDHHPSPPVFSAHGDHPSGFADEMG